MGRDDIRTELERLVRRHRLSPEVGQELSRLLDPSAPWTTSSRGMLTYGAPSIHLSASSVPHGTPTVDIPESPRAASNASPLRLLEEVELQQVIGRGGVGEVWRVRDDTLQRRLALKTLLPERAHRADLIHRFCEEARVIARLQHPGIVPIHSIGCLKDGRVAFTMQEIRGSSLRRVIHAVHQASSGQIWRPEPEDGPSGS